jgi:hypothetical protein
MLDENSSSCGRRVLTALHSEERKEKDGTKLYRVVLEVFDTTNRQHAFDATQRTRSSHTPTPWQREDGNVAQYYMNPQIPPLLVPHERLPSSVDKRSGC